MNNLLVITPVKDSLATTEVTIRSVMRSETAAHWHYVVYDDFSQPDCAARLDQLATEYGFEVVHLADVTDTPSPNYRLVLQIARQRAIDTDAHLVILESDVEVRRDSLQNLWCCAETAAQVGMVASVTTDEQGNTNFPYLYARRWRKENNTTRKHLSFCFTLLSNHLLRAIDFKRLDPTRQWYDVHISHQSVSAGFNNILMMRNPVIHRPHSSRPWKQLKYTNPLKYYWIKLTRGYDKI